ncbi:MAG TPA: hypothetical protein VFI96_02525, partial [Longimicrobiaceae bacterium]|nr:hypothetical protein [Longimicrobiaceae bacterium]
LLLLAGAAAVTPPLARAQAPADSSADYRREIFSYERGGRPDPFRPLLSSIELGVRIEDLTLRGVIYNRQPGRSVAVIEQTGVERLRRVRAGDRIGTVRILSIGPRSVDVVVNELGVTRRATLQLKRPSSNLDSKKGGSR